MHKSLIASMFVGGLITGAVHGSVILMNGDDANGTTSFNTGLHWTGGQAPTAGNDYSTGAHALRTPADSNSYTFAGDSLTVANGGTLILKAYSNKTYSFGSLILAGGTVGHGGNSFTVKIAGPVTLVSGTTSTIRTPAGDSANVSRIVEFSGVISGAGALTVLSDSGADGKLVRLTNANSFSGGIAIGSTLTGQNYNALVEVTHDHGLGTGNIAFVAHNGNTTASQLTLTGGVDAPSVDFIADNATLTIASSSLALINLNFTGTDIIGSLVVNGVSLGAGVYGSATNADPNVIQLNYLTGTGTLTVAPVPEPAAFGLLSGATFLMFLRSRKSTS